MGCITNPLNHPPPEQLAKAIVIVGLATFANGLQLRGGPTDSAQLLTYETEYLQKQAQAQVAEEKYKTLLQSTMTGSMGFIGGTGTTGTTGMTGAASTTGTTETHRCE